MRVLRPVFAGSLVLSLALGVLAIPAHADPSPADAATAWLIDQQEADGGFELANFPPFETPDAALAIAANAQTTGTWSTSEAVAAVEAVNGGTAGANPLDSIDDFAESVNLTAGTAAKLIVLTALPFGEDPTAFDPSDDGTPVDLTAGLDTISPGLFNSFAFGRLAETQLNEEVSQADLQVLCEAAKPTGGWSFDGLPDNTNSPDLDSTGTVVMALRAAGVPANDPVLAAAETYVSGAQQANGSWQSFGSDDPNSTVLAMWAWLALDNGIADLAHDPIAYLVSQQLSAPPADAGRIQSPNDGFGVNTFATTQGIQGLLLAAGETGADWLPVPGNGGRHCIPEATSYSDVAPTAWFDDGARFVDENNIVNGINGEFRPNGNVNRAQAAQWLNLMFGDVGGDPNTFPDVPSGAWYEDGVNFVGDAPNGVIATGIGGLFKPRQNLNRAQAVSWLYAAAGSPDSDAPDFTDVATNAWFADAAGWAQQHGIVSGFQDGSFRPTRNVSRGQMAQWLFNLAAEPSAWDGGATLPPSVLFAL